MTPGTYRITVGAERRLKPKDFARAIADLRAFGGRYDADSRTWTVVYDGESALGLVVSRYDLLAERLED
jgi:hypothetical protein